MIFDSLDEAILVEDCIQNSIIYWNKRKQEFEGKIPSMQVDGSKFAGGNYTLNEIVNNRNNCHKALDRVREAMSLLESN